MKTERECCLVWWGDVTFKENCDGDWLSVCERERERKKENHSMCEGLRKRELDCLSESVVNVLDVTDGTVRPERGNR